jgi:hypothetical protein
MPVEKEYPSGIVTNVSNCASPRIANRMVSRR